MRRAAAQQCRRRAPRVAAVTAPCNTEAANAGVRTVHNSAHNVRSPDHTDASLKAIADSKLRARFGFGLAQGTPPDKLQDLEDVKGRGLRENCN